MSNNGIDKNAVIEELNKIMETELAGVACRYIWSTTH